MVLAQSDVTDFVVSPNKALPSLRNDGEWDRGKVGETREGEGKGTGIAMKNFFKKMF